jgi:hypothetical protein
MLPGRPGKAFSKVVMSLFSSASKIECQRHLPHDFQTPQVHDAASQKQDSYCTLVQLLY